MILKKRKTLIKILIVEAEFSSRRILKLFLSPLGKIDIAVNTTEAISAVKKGIDNNQHYQLVFLDIMMPKLDGVSALKKIRQLENQQGLNDHAKSKVIITSASPDKDVILKAARAGCSSYMIKPIDKIRLYNEIRKHGFEIPGVH